MESINSLKIFDKISTQGSLKRPEENYKFIFKKTLKHMKEHFKENGRKKRIRKQDLEQEFQSYYFKTMGNKSNIN